MRNRLCENVAEGCIMQTRLGQQYSQAMRGTKSNGCFRARPVLFPARICTVPCARAVLEHTGICARDRAVYRRMCSAQTTAAEPETGWACRGSTFGAFYGGSSAANPANRWGW